MKFPLLAKDSHSFEREGGEEKEGERGERADLAKDNARFFAS